MKRIRLVPAALSVAILALGAGGGPGTSERYAYSTYREISGRLTLLVDGYVAAFHTSDRFVAVTVAVGLSGPGPTVLVTPESFRLLDASGKEYSPVPFRDILEGHPKQQFDASLVRSHGIVVGNQFDMSIRLEGNFYPATADRNLRVARVELAPFTWFATPLYFPRPEGGLDGVLTLRIGGGGIEPPLEVRFRVPPVVAEPTDGQPASPPTSEELAPDGWS